METTTAETIPMRQTALVSRQNRWKQSSAWEWPCHSLLLVLAINDQRRSLARSCDTTEGPRDELCQLYKQVAQLSLTNPRDALHHDERQNFKTVTWHVTADFFWECTREFKLYRLTPESRKRIPPDFTHTLCIAKQCAWPLIIHNFCKC